MHASRAADCLSAADERMAWPARPPAPGRLRPRRARSPIASGGGRRDRTIVARDRFGLTFGTFRRAVAVRFIGGFREALAKLGEPLRKVDEGRGVDRPAEQAQLEVHVRASGIAGHPHSADLFPRATFWPTFTPMVC